MSPYLSVTWLRIFDHAGSSFACVTFAVCVFWLASRKFIGHRSLLIHIGIWTALRSVSHVELMWATYSNNQASWIVTTSLTLATMAGVTLAAHVLMVLNDLLSTLTQTEADEMLRQDHESDEQQRLTLRKWIVDANGESGRKLATEARRPLP